VVLVVTIGVLEGIKLNLINRSCMVADETEEIDMAGDIKKSAKQKKPRPDGYEEDRYKNLEKWTYHRWAWEFLRRNEDFIKACEKTKILADGDEQEEKKRVAAEFRLAKFKNYTEGYTSGAGKPIFTIGTIRTWGSLIDDKEISIKLKAGQMVVRFNLNNMLDDAGSYTKQLRLAEAKVSLKLEELKALMNHKEKVQHKPRPHPYGQYLRILDHLASGKSHLECANLIFPENANINDKTEMQSFISSPIRAARKLAKTGYLNLSLHAGKPSVETFPLQRFVEISV